MGQSPLREKSFAFAKRIVILHGVLRERCCDFALSRQLLKSGTSIGANVREAQNAESPLDFAHKLSIAQKEADEAAYWLELLKATDFLSETEFKSLESNVIELVKMIRSSILTTKQKFQRTGDAQG